MKATEALTDSFQRIRALVEATLEGLDEAALTWRPDPEANTIAWLVWHLARIEDDHIAGVTDRDQVWASDAWAERFGLEPGAMDIGYGHSPEEVAAVRPEGAQTLLAYHDEVTGRTLVDLEGLDADDLDRVVDDAWDPPVTAGIRLLSVVGDCLQHLGQAAYVRGMWERRAAGGS
jgi:hypothetical protein